MKSNFRDLDVWKVAREYRKEICDLCKTFPNEEKYRLTDQMVRASRSITSNIAEGYGRFHYQENIQFCRQSRGSTYEMIDHIALAVECEYIDNGKEQYYTNQAEEIIRLLNGYITKTAISKATLMSFPLVGNLSEKTRRIADKPQ